MQEIQDVDPVRSRAMELAVTACGVTQQAETVVHFAAVFEIFLRNAADPNEKKPSVSAPTPAATAR